MRDADLDPDPANCAFDGKEPGCVWHRLMIDGTIPSGTQVSVQSRAADSKSALAATPWNPEPPPYRRFTGAELPLLPPARAHVEQDGHLGTALSGSRRTVPANPAHSTGNGRSTPRLQALRAYYPRFSYLKKYLPAVYQNDPTSASFVERYLANPEGFFTVLEGRIQQVQELFDPRTVPADYLDWLAGWMGNQLRLHLDDRNAPVLPGQCAAFFSRVAHPDGLVRMIRMSLDQCANASLFAPTDLQHFSVRIVESYLLRSAPGVTFGDPGPQTPGSVTS